MKAVKKYFAAALMLTLFCSIKPATVKAQDVSFQVFYDDLSPYGQWVDYASYGYVWVPSAGPDFTPYSSGGHWVWTDYGWTWASDYSWGWAPFHYGRWDYDSYYGWVWIPDTEWAPAWVSWRQSPGYYGWAPLGPGIGFEMAIGSYNPPADHWIFVDQHYMGNSDMRHHYGPRGSNQTYINNSTVINNTYVDNSSHNTYVSGPRREDVQKASGKEIKPVTIKENTKPGQKLSNNELNIYRPHVAKGAADVKPAKIAAKTDVKPIAERPAMNKAAAPANKANAGKTPAGQNPALNAKPTNQKAAPKTPRPATAPAKQPALNPKPANQKQNPVTPKTQPQQHPAQQPKQKPIQQQPRPQAQPKPQAQPQQQPIRQQPNPQPRQQAPQPQHQQPAPAPQPRQEAPAPRPMPAPAPAPVPQPEPNRPR